MYSLLSNRTSVVIIKYLEVKLKKLNNVIINLVLIIFNIISKKLANQFILFFTNIGAELASKIKIHPDKSYKKYLIRKTSPEFDFNIISDIEIMKVIDH